MAIDVRNGYRVYHWKHGWIPLTHVAAMKKAKGDPKLAQKYLDKYNIRGDVHKSFANTDTSPAGVGGSGAHFRGADGFQSVAREHLQRAGNVVAAFNKNTGNFHLLDVDKGRAVVVHADVAEAIQRGRGNIVGVKDAGSAGKLLKVDFGTDGIAHVEVHDDPNVKPRALNPIKAAPAPKAATVKPDGDLTRAAREGRISPRKLDQLREERAKTPKPAPDARVNEAIRAFDAAKNLEELRGVKTNIGRQHQYKPFAPEHVSLLNNGYKVRKNQLELEAAKPAPPTRQDVRDAINGIEGTGDYDAALKVIQAAREGGVIDSIKQDDYARRAFKALDAKRVDRILPTPREFNRMFRADRLALLDKIEAEQGKDAREAFEANAQRHQRLRFDVWNRIDKYRGGKQQGPVLKSNIRSLERQGVLDADEARRWNRIVDQKVERAARLKERRDRLNARRGGAAAPRGAGGTSHAAADVSPEAKQAQIDHFAAGGTVMDAPQNGLWNHIASNPDRFEVVAQRDKKGVSDVYKVKDKQTGERLFAKKSAFRNDVHKEVAAAAVANQLGLTKHKARFGQSPDGSASGGVVLMQDAASANGKEALERVGDLRHGTDIPGKVAKGSRPGGFVDMALFDYLIDNSVDRHANNAFLLQNKDGSLDVGFLDHGLAFKVDGAPDFTSWFRRDYRASQWGIADYIGRAAGGRDNVARQTRDTLDRLRQLDIDATIESASSKHAGIPTEYADLMKKRLAVLLDPANETAIITALAQAA